MEESKKNDFCMHLTNGENEGYVTCFDCGLVLDNSVFISEYKHKEESPSYEEECCFHELYSRGLISNYLKDICIFNVNKWKNEKLSYTKYHCSFALYYFSRKISYPLSLNQICNIFNQSKKEVCLLQKFFPDNESIDYENYIEKYAAFLNLEYSLMKKIKKKSKNFRNRFFLDPSTFAAVIFSLVDGIDLKQLSEISCVSYSMIIKWRKKFIAYKKIKKEKRNEKNTALL